MLLAGLLVGCAPEPNPAPEVEKPDSTEQAAPAQEGSAESVAEENGTTVGPAADPRPEDMNGRWCYEEGLPYECFDVEYPNMYAGEGYTANLHLDENTLDDCFGFGVGYENSGGGSYLYYCPIGVDSMTVGNEDLTIERIYIGQDAPGNLAMRE